jgi:fructosamine-3-kinase
MQPEQCYSISVSTFMHPSIATILGQAVLQQERLSGGCIGDVYRLTLADRSRVVAKLADDPAAGLETEAFMLHYLHTRSKLPVPTVLHSEPTLLLMTYHLGTSFLDAAAEQDAAHHIAALHSIRGAAFGLERDTVIGGLQQPNTLSPTWIPFFREQRLLHMAQEAERIGRLPGAVRSRVERLAGQLERWLIEPAYPALIHGDLWTGNILAHQGTISAFLDPAIYYAHPEIELAFTTLFGTFDEAFFEQYQHHHPLTPGFFEERRDLYNLYPLLVHVRLFGGGYVQAVTAILSKFGC